MKEPTVTIKMVTPPVTNPNLTDVNIVAGVIYSDYGTNEPTLVQSRSELIRLFSTKSTLVSSDDITFKHAYDLLDTLPVLVCRAGTPDTTLNTGTSVKSIIPEMTKAEFDALTYTDKNKVYVIDDSGTTKMYIWDSDNDTWLITTLATAQLFKVIPKYEGDKSNTIDGINIYFKSSDLSGDNYVISENTLIGIIYNGIEYVGSLNPDYINQYNVNQFIGNINSNDEIPFTLDTSTIVDPTLTTISINKNLVNSVTYTYSSPSIEIDAWVDPNMPTQYDSTSFSDALTKLVEQENYQIAYMTTMGIDNATVANDVANAADSIYAFSPYGVTSFTTASSLNVSAINSANCIVFVPYDLTYKFGFKMNLSLANTYIKRVEALRSTGNEFAPVFGQNLGAVSVSRLSSRLTKSEREGLLDKRIMSVTYDGINDINYINKNKTRSSSDDVMSEEQNRRLAYKINRDLDILLVQFLGQYNTEQTRSRVRSVIYDYLSNNIQNQNYGLNSCRVVCDETNNTPSVIASNRLIVDLYAIYNNAIYEILVYHRTYDINNAPSE